MGKLNVGRLEGIIQNNYVITIPKGTDVEVKDGAELRLQNQTYLNVPSGDNATRSKTPVNRQLRYNTESKGLEMFSTQSNSWLANKRNSGASYIEDGLIWQFDPGDAASYSGSGTTINDLVGSYNGNFYNASSANTNGPVYDADGQGSLSFDGSNDWIEVNSLAPLFASRTADFTFSVWAKSNYSRDGVRGDVLLSMHAGTSNRFRWQVKTNAIFLSDFNTAGDTNYSHAALTAGTWHQYVIQGDNQNNRIGIFLDGANVDTVDMDSGFGESDINRVSIGQEWDGGGPSEYYSGLMSVWVLYDRKLSDAEIQANYDNTKGRYGIA